MENSSDTRTETIGGAFFVRKKKNYRSERKKGEKNAEDFLQADNRHFFACLFGKRDFFAQRLMDK